MKFAAGVGVGCVLLLVLFAVGCSEEKKEGEVVVVDTSIATSADDKVAVENVSIADGGLDSAIAELEEFEGNSS